MPNPSTHPHREQTLVSRAARCAVSFMITGLFFNGCQSPTTTDSSPITQTLESKIGSPLGPSRSAAVIIYPDSIDFSDGVDQYESVAIALWNNVGFRESLTQLDVAQADMVQAGLLPNPSISILSLLGSHQIEYDTILSVNALWFRQKKMALADLALRGVADTLIHEGLTLARETKTAYAQLISAKATTQLSRQQVEIHKRLNELYGRPIEHAGDISGEAEALDAKTALVASRRQHIDAELALQTARTQLMHLMGLIDSEIELEFEPKSIAPLPEADLANLLPMAYDNRSDLHAAWLMAEAALEKAGLVRSDFIQIEAQIKATDFSNRSADHELGLLFTLPIFDQNQGRSAKADADTQQALLHYIKIKHDIQATLAHAIHRHTTAIARDRLDTEHVEIATQHLDALTKALQAGAASEAERFNAMRTIIEAQMQKVQSAAELDLSIAELEEQLGLSVDAPHAPQSIHTGDFSHDSPRP